MTGNLLDRIMHRESVGFGNGADTDDLGIDDFGTFGFLRGSRECAVMLELRKKDGNILAIGYGWVEKISFDPSIGIALHLGGMTVWIKGRNLNTEAVPRVKLFEAIARHRVPWIQEVSQQVSMTAPKGAPVVDSIEW